MSKKGNKRKPYNARKSRAKGTITMINLELQNLEVNDIISNIYIKPKNEFERWLIKEIEKQLILSKIKPNEFEDNLVKFYKTIANTIKQENKMKDFYYFTYKAYFLLDSRETIKRKVSIVYYSFLIELSTYFTPIGNFMVGVSSKGKSITVSEWFPKLDEAYDSAFRLAKVNSDNPNKVFYNELAKFGYKVKSHDELEGMLLAERIVINNFFIMAFLIDENDSEYQAKPYFIPKTTNTFVPKTANNTDYLKHLLLERKRFLPKQGIYLNGFMRTDMQEVYMKEKFCLDRIFMLYRIKINDSYTIGFYDTKEKFFYSAWNDTHNPIGINKHYELENFILELYANISCDIDTDINVEYYIHEESEVGKVKSNKIKKYNKNCYKGVLTHIDAYVRKLPVGATASQESIELAKKYGIKLSSDETFVKAFDKKVYQK